MECGEVFNSKMDLIQMLACKNLFYTLYYPAGISEHFTILSLAFKIIIVRIVLAAE